MGGVDVLMPVSLSGFWVRTIIEGPFAGGIPRLNDAARVQRGSGS